MSKLVRLEIWDDFEGAGGVRLAMIPRDSILSAVRREKIDGTDELEAQLDTSVAPSEPIKAARGVENRVLLALYTDGSVTDHRVREPSEARGDRGELTRRVKAEGPLLELRNGVIRRVEANGHVTLVWTLLSNTVDQLVDLILPFAPALFSKGTIDEATTVIEAFTFDGDSPLSALQELAALADLELAVRRQTGGTYLVDLVTQVGASASVPDFRLAKNIASLLREIDTTEQANRITALGGGDGVVRMTLGVAEWEVLTTPTTTTLTVEGDPIFEDGHLVGAHLERISDGSRFEITATTAPASITVASDHGLAPGDLVALREDSAGTQLVYVEAPGSQADYGVLHDVIVEDDIPFTDNLAPNPALRFWSGGLPGDWVAVGGATLSEDNQEIHTKAGGAAAKVVAAAAGEGIQSDPITVEPTETRIYFSAAVSFFIESGAVEVFVEHSVDGRIPPIGSDAAKPTTVKDQIVTVLVEGIEMSSGTVTINVVASGGAATFYLDSAQLVRHSAVLPFFEGRASQALWARGLRELSLRSDPVISYKLPRALDLYAARPVDWPYDAVTLGGDARIVDGELGVSVQTRVLAVTRDILGATSIDVDLATSRDDIVARLAELRRRKRRDEPPIPVEPAPEILNMEIEIDRGIVNVHVTANAHTKSVRLAASSSGAPSEATIRAAAAQDGSVLTFTNVLSGVIPPNGVVFVGAFAYAQAAGTGAESALARANTTWIPVETIEPTGKNDLVLNRGFEDGWAFWGAPDGQQVQSSVVFAGAQALELTSEASGGSHRDAYQTDDPSNTNSGIASDRLIKIPVKEGDILFLTAAGRANHADARLVIGVRRWDENKTHLGWSPLLTWENEDWTLKAAKFTVPSGLHFVTLWLSGQDLGATAQKVYIDDLSLRAVKKADEIDDALFTDAGDLASGVSQVTGATVKTLAKGNILVEGQDGDAADYSTAGFNTPPLWSLRQKALVWDSAFLSTGRLYHDGPKLINITALTADIRARLRDKATATNQEDDFASGADITTVGGNDDANLANAPSNDDSYVVHFDVELVVIGEPGATKTGTLKVTVAIFTNDGGGWTERWSNQYSCSQLGEGTNTCTWTHEQIEIAVSGLGVDDDIRIEVTEEIWTPGSGTWSRSFEVNPYVKSTDGTAGATYQTSADSFATMTPDGEDKVSFQVWEG